MHSGKTGGSCMRVFVLFVPIFTLIAFSGCMMSAYEHHKELPQTQERETTVGIVQRDIKKGMSQADVAEALGSPNIVTKDSNGLETWIYDKIASEVSYSQSGGGILVLLGFQEKEAGAAASTQRTLTVVIKFKDNSVHDFSYHSSKF